TASRHPMISDVVRYISLFFFSSRRRHTRWPRDWSSDVCSSDLRRTLRTPYHVRTTVRLLPREEEFFDLFVAVATRSTVAAQHLRELFDAPPERRIAHVEAIKRLEHEADQVTHEVVNRLDRTFIMPLDRE